MIAVRSLTTVTVSMSAVDRQTGSLGAISAATVSVTKPDGTPLSPQPSPTLVNGGATMRATFDVDAPGVWKVRATLTLADGRKVSDEQRVAAS